MGFLQNLMLGAGTCMLASGNMHVETQHLFLMCSTRPDLSISPQPSEQQHAQMQGHARHARRGEHARPGGCGGSRTRVRPGHRPLLTRMHLFPLRLSAAAHIASPIYPRSQGELASRFCLHGGSCPTPPSCTTAACIPHHLCV